VTGKGPGILKRGESAIFQWGKARAFSREKKSTMRLFLRGRGAGRRSYYKGIGLSCSVEREESLAARRPIKGDLNKHGKKQLRPSEKRKSFKKSQTAAGWSIKKEPRS